MQRQYRYEVARSGCPAAILKDRIMYSAITYDGKRLARGQA